MDLNSINTRSDRRSPLFHTAVMIFDGQKHFLGIARNISRSGMFIQTPVPAKVGEIFDLKFSLPNTSMTVSCRSEVKWSSSRSVAPGGVSDEGLKFLDIPPVVADKVNDWVKDQFEAGSNNKEAGKLFGLQEVIDGLADPIMVIDRNYNVVLSNTAAVKQYGKDGYCYERVHGLKAPCDDAKYPCPLKMVVETRQPVMVEQEFLDDSGNASSYKIIASPLKDADGEVTAIVHAMQDITDLKQTGGLACAAVRGKNDSLEMVNHDLRSLLASLLGYSELLLSIKKDSFDSETLNIITGIKRCSVRLLGMVEDFFALSSADSQDLKIHLALEDFVKTFRESQEEFTVCAKEKGIKLHTDVEDNIPKTMMDKRLVQRAISNLLLNAVKYTPANGAITVNIGRHADKDGDFIVTTITDTGMGIPVEEQEKVFSKYYRSTKTAGIPGSGLGLSITKAVAEAHGGKIEFKSTEGNGSTFKLFLPVTKTTD